MAIIDLSKLTLHTRVESPFTTKGSQLSVSEMDQSVATLGEFLLQLQSQANVNTYSNATTYQPGAVVGYQNKLWLQTWNGSPTGVIGNAPYNGSPYWSEISIGWLAHKKNKDTILDEGGANEVTAAQLKRIVDYEERLIFNKTITSSQLLNANSVPIELVAAPTGNKAIVVVDAWVELLFSASSPTSQPYEGYGQIMLITNGADMPQYQSQNNLLSQAKTKAITRKLAEFTNGYNDELQIIENQSLNFTIRNGNPASGNFDIKIYGNYYLA